MAVLSEAERLAEEVVRRYEALRMSRSYEDAKGLIEVLKAFAPPGVEWGIELFRAPGISYIAEGGRVIALRLSRDEFGPFMQTRLTDVDLDEVPKELFKDLLERPEEFLSSVRRHLVEWLRRAPEEHELRGRVVLLLEVLERVC